ncbi:hypothetical protein [Hydrogenimonas sp.]
MFDLILFGAIGLLLLVLVGLLVIVVRDHLKSRSFELHLQQEADTRPPLDEPQTLHEPAPAPEKTKESAERAAQSEPAAAKRTEHKPANRRIDEEAERKFQEKLRQSLAAQRETAPASVTTAQESPADPTVTPQHPEKPAAPRLTEAQKQAREIMEKDFGRFDHTRLVEGMGLSPQEADEFVVELIHQLETAIPDLDAAIEEHRYVDVERITHGLKGAALNIGEGGVAQLLVEYNTYMKHGNERPIVEAYQSVLKRSVSELKVEYSQVA